MGEDDLRQMIGRVKNGSLSRRGFVRRMAAVGFTAPMATQLLAIAALGVFAMLRLRPGRGGKEEK